jgi:hypothetical protein
MQEQICVILGPLNLNIVNHNSDVPPNRKKKLLQLCIVFRHVADFSHKICQIYAKLIFGLPHTTNLTQILRSQIDKSSFDK